MRVKHLDRYVHEFIGRRESRQFDMLEQVHASVTGIVGKPLRDRNLATYAAVI